jgi:hypothetical protein
VVGGGTQVLAVERLWTMEVCLFGTEDDGEVTWRLVMDIKWLAGLACALDPDVVQELQEKKKNHSWDGYQITTNSSLPRSKLLGKY